MFEIQLYLSGPSSIMLAASWYFAPAGTSVSVVIGGGVGVGVGVVQWLKEKAMRVHAPNAEKNAHVIPEQIEQIRIDKAEEKRRGWNEKRGTNERAKGLHHQNTFQLHIPLDVSNERRRRNKEK